jgi:hypothetical protein
MKITPPPVAMRGWPRARLGGGRGDGPELGDCAGGGGQRDLWLCLIRPCKWHTVYSAAAVLTIMEYVLGPDAFLSLSFFFLTARSRDNDTS